MPTLHLLPGQGPGETAEITVNPPGLKRLTQLIGEATHDGYACHRFKLRDGEAYSLWLRVIDRPLTSKAWREVPFGHNGVRKLRRYQDGQLFDLDLLSQHLIGARKHKGDDQRHAAQQVGRSVGFISAIENGTSLPRPESLAKLCDYIGTVPADYFAMTTAAPVPVI